MCIRDSPRSRDDETPGQAGGHTDQRVEHHRVVLVRRERAQDEQLRRLRSECERSRIDARLGHHHRTRHAEPGFKRSQRVVAGHDDHRGDVESALFRVMQAHPHLMRQRDVGVQRQMGDQHLSLIHI